MSSRGAAAIIAGLLLLVGVLLGFSTHSIPNDTMYSSLGDKVSCGSVFFGSNDPEAADYGSGNASVQTHGLAPTTNFQSQCSDAQDGTRAVALTLTGIGLLGLLFCALTTKPSEKPIPAAPESVESA